MASEIAFTTSTKTVSELGNTQTALAKDHSRESSEEDENLPEGVTYSLNLKRLIGQLRRLVTTLELLCEGTAATLRQVIKGKLV